MRDDPGLPVAQMSLAAKAIYAARKHGNWERLLRQLTVVMREPWREYFPYRPDDLPPPKGSPETVSKLLHLQRLLDTRKSAKNTN